MPRFYFDISDGSRESLDEEGTEFADLAAACDEAVAVLPAIAASEGRAQTDREIVAIVRDEGGAKLFRARLSVTREVLGADSEIA